MDAKDITNFISGDSQSKGLSKIPKLILDKNQKLISKINPDLEKELNKYKNTCPTQEELTRLLNKRNNIVSQLDDLSKFITQQKNIVNGLNINFNIAKTIITNTKRAKKLVSLGSKAIPSPPGVPGIVSSGISDLGDIVFDQIFTDTGLPKLEKLKSQTDGIQSSLDITLNSISKTTDKLNSLDSLIKKCYPDVNLGQLPNGLKDIINENSQLKNKSSRIRYRGFILKIETKKFNERLTQSRAVALNRSEIIEYSTEYSFTLNPNVLIEELKQIINKA
jgi:DNA repair ATPase RecN